MKGDRHSLLFLLLLITAISFLHTIKLMNRGSINEVRDQSKSKMINVAAGNVSIK